MLIMGRIGRISYYISPLICNK